MKQFGARILRNRRIAPGWMELSFSWDESAGVPLPGQFFTLKASPFSDPLLRRPFAFSDFSENVADAIYQVRGPATRLLASLASDSSLDIIAPLGKGFPVSDTTVNKPCLCPEAAMEPNTPADFLPRPAPPPCLLVAGGIGLGPVLFLARFLAGMNPSCGLEFVAGFRNSESIPDIELPEGLTLCTDDGSSGFHGTTVDYLSARPLSPGTRLYACGPHPMLAALARLALERRCEAYFSVEQWMACGVGACMGCAVRRADGGYSRACADGPVFRADEIDWEGTR